jgi:hypothetical protein
MGHEKGDTVDGYCNGSPVGAYFSGEQCPARPISGFGTAMGYRLEAV